MTVTEKVAYLKGLAEGLDVKADSKEGKLLTAIMDVLSDMALDLEDLADDVTEMSEHVDAIDEDLNDLETDFYEDYDDEDEDDGFYDVTCPNCGEEFSVDEETLLEGSIACPNCGEDLEFDLDECDGDCGNCNEDCEDKE